MAEGMGADAIDINMGCPAKQVVKTGAGADLMRFPEKVKGILIEVRKKVKSLITIKIRSGWDGEHINAVEISKIAEDCGIDAISIHPRTRVQGFRGQSGLESDRRGEESGPYSCHWKWRCDHTLFSKEDVGRDRV